ncbi:peroxide stress protein YaaA [Streptomyces sp. DSM 44917]|uniref:Peroxide stress protein YaaA n=1 Tax=Streptomyces boetiae TaxID=3075541 RepID=A0ABU2L3F5_9ACTN|nr:peroxide stress protein YaaA [Streptomyces sp. DSM 44917]MDT0306096.1 peroxide stress protein YaaA [Streptomyces sp. DSM 44917]
MLVLLPPSEGKAEGTSGAPVDLGRLSLPGLTAARERVLGELIALCAGDEGKAREVLGLSEGQRGEVARNAALREAPARPAGEVYTGVLFDALGLATLSPAARRRARASLLVFSGLWGAVRITDRVPAYRCPVGVRLPGVGALGAFWRGPLAEELTETAGAGPVLDLRSSAYAAMWRPAGETARRTVDVRVLQSRIVGGVEKRSVVSHFNKATKGRLLRDLLEAGPLPRGAGRVAGALRDLGWRAEERPGAANGPGKGRGNGPGGLDVIVTEV